LQVQAKLLAAPSSSPEDVQDAINTLRRTPINVTLLKDSGVGKTVKKATKKVDAEFAGQLEDLLSGWMQMAATDGIVEQDGTTEEDLVLAKTCLSWRQLFGALRQRHEEIRSIQGKRIRESRTNVSDSHAPLAPRTRPWFSLFLKYLTH
jgi:hypothetical protein